MKLTIFAATGGIGRQVLEQAVAAGHDVTAVVRNPKRLSRQVRIVTADLAAAKLAVLETALAGSSWKPVSSTIHSRKPRLCGVVPPALSFYFVLGYDAAG